MNRIERLFADHPSPEAFASEYLKYLSGVLASIDVTSIGAFARALLDVRNRNATVYFIGNGGSAATASHFANDLAIGTCSWQQPFRVVSLTDNVAVITAIANDYGYEDVFLKQLQVLLQPRDLVVAISASGNSPNLVKAIEFSRERGALTVALTGFDGGRLRTLADIVVHVPSGKGEYGPVEDAHMVLDHLLGAFLKQACVAAQSTAK